MAKVSIILPVFNAEATVGRAIDSILRQSFRDLELIVVDDGSTDRTRDIISSIDDVRIKTISIAHSGVAAAANSGLQSAQGALVARMDADDVAHPEKLAKQVDFLRRNNVDVVGCQIRILDANQQPVESLARYADWINRETLDADSILALRFVEFPLVNPTILANRSYFEIGYRDNEMPEDYELFLRAAEAGFRFAKVDQCLFDWYDLPGRLTRSHSCYCREAFQQCRKVHLLSGPLKNHSEVDLWGAGKAGKPWFRWLEQEGIRVRNWYDISPKRINQRIHETTIQPIDALVPASQTPLLIAVGRGGARDLIQPFIAQRNYVLGDSAWFIA